MRSLEPVAADLKPGWLGELPRLPWDWPCGRLVAERNYWLVTTRADGAPQARPVWGVWDDDRLFMSIGGGGLGRVEMPDGAPATAHVDSAANVVIVEGALRRVARPGRDGGAPIDLARLERILAAWNAKYDKAWTPDTHTFNFCLEPAAVLAWRENAERTNADGAGKWTFR